MCSSKIKRISLRRKENETKTRVDFDDKDSEARFSIPIMNKMLLEISARTKRFTVPNQALPGLLLLVAVLGLSATSAVAAEIAITNSAAAKAEETNSSSQELRVYLQLQEQLHATQLAVERIRKEAAE